MSSRPQLGLAERQQFLKNIAFEEWKLKQFEKIYPGKKKEALEKINKFNLMYDANGNKVLKKPMINK